MRGFLKALVAVSGLAFLLTLSINMALAFRMGRQAAPVSEADGREALFHIIAILPESDGDGFYADALAAMHRAAGDSGAVMQVLRYAPAGRGESAARMLALAAELEPDAVIAALPQEPGITESTQALAAAGIPLVTLESDASGGSRAAFVGTNPYGIGTLAAKAVAEGFPQGADVALVLASAWADARGATIVAGFMQGLRSRPDIRLAMTRTAAAGPAASEEIVRELLGGRAGIDVAVFTGARDAEGAARALIEYDRVGAFAIVGFGDDPALLELMESGVVLATVARSPDRAGEAAVAAAMNLARGERTGAYVDPGLRLIQGNGDGQ